MYSSVSSLHIALDGRLQQLNSNRKQAIMPEQYDVALNDAINIVLKQRLSAKLNSKREGYEDSVAAYDLVKSLKRTCRPTCYLDSIENKWGFELPSNYFMFDTLQANINYDRTNVAHSSNCIDTTKYVTVVEFTKEYIFKKDNITYDVPRVSGNGFIHLGGNDIHLVGTSNKASFYYFNLIKDFIKSNNKLDCYFENYLDFYYPNSLIFVANAANKVPTTLTISDNDNNPYEDIVDVSVIAWSKNTVIKTNITTPRETTIDMGSKKVDLVSSLNDTNETTDFYLHYNNHLNPKCTMQDGVVYLTSDPTFYYTNVRLNYIKQPRPIDIRINQMTDMEIADDILDVATQILVRVLNLRDPYAEQEAEQQKQQRDKR